MELGQEGRRVRDRVGREASVGPCRPIGQAGPMGSSLDSMMLQRIRSREWRQLSCDLGHDGGGSIVRRERDQEGGFCNGPSPHVLTSHLTCHRVVSAVYKEKVAGWGSQLCGFAAVGLMACVE